MLFATFSHPIPHIIHLPFPTYFHHIQCNFLSCCKVSSYITLSYSDLLPLSYHTSFQCILFSLLLYFHSWYITFFCVLLPPVILLFRFLSCFSTSSQSVLLLNAHAIFYSTSLHHIQYHYLSFFITSSSHFLSTWPSSFHSILYCTSSYHYLLYYLLSLLSSFTTFYYLCNLLLLFIIYSTTFSKSYHSDLLFLSLEVLTLPLIL